VSTTGGDTLMLEWRERCAEKDREIERLREELARARSEALTAWVDENLIPFLLDEVVNMRASVKLPAKEPSCPTTRQSKNQK
jgi:hypothetical protein